MSTDEAIAYAQRGHGERSRPASGWASLTLTERDVVRLFISPRTVQTHLTHVYTNLELTSRVQLVQEAGRQATTASQETPLGVDQSRSRRCAYGRHAPQVRRCAAQAP
jgi:DNA-binding CsgD family transcriptional regulator